MSTESDSSFRLPSVRYRRVFDARNVWRGRLLVMHVRREPDAGRKAGVVVSKRVFPRAVDRNRAKRLMREAFRLGREKFADDVELILVARAGIAGKKMPEVASEIAYFRRKAGLDRPASGT